MKNNIKMLAIDLDGTLLSTAESALSQRNLRAIRACIDKGILVAVATGRMRHRLPEAFLSIEGVRYLITSNGAAVVDLEEDEILFNDPLPMETVKEVVALLEEHQLYYELYHQGYAYMNQKVMDRYDGALFYPEQGLRRTMERSRKVLESLAVFFSDRPWSVNKVNIPYLPPELQSVLHEALNRLEGVTVTVSLTNNAEVNKQGTTKAKGIAFLCRHLGLTPEEVMAFGDADNDLAMLEAVGYPVAMGNALDSLKEIAWHVTASNDEDGVAQAIERFLLMEA